MRGGKEREKEKGGRVCRKEMERRMIGGEEGKGARKKDKRTEEGVRRIRKGNEGRSEPKGKGVCGGKRSRRGERKRGKIK